METDLLFEEGKKERKEKGRESKEVERKGARDEGMTQGRENGRDSFLSFRKTVLPKYWEKWRRESKPKPTGITQIEEDLVI